MCQPLKNGGGEITDLQGQNYAFLAKLAFQLVHNPEMLWVQIVRAKYNWPASKNYHFQTCNASHIWRSISKVWAKAELNIEWRLGDRKTIRFWSDSWVCDNGALKLLSFADIPSLDLSLPISKFIDELGQWRWNKFRHLLPPHILEQISMIGRQAGSIELGLCYWNGTNNGTFTVSFAYHAKLFLNWNEASPCWNLMWKWPGLQRVRSFLWLAIKQKLLTNVERANRKMTLDDSYNHYHAGP